MGLTFKALKMCYNCVVKLISKVKLLTTPEQHAALLATLERANEACNYISGVAWDTHPDV